MKLYLHHFVFPCVTIFLFIATTIVQAEAWQTIAKPQIPQQSDTVEVIEFFWYGCGHCYSLEEPLYDWEQNKPDHVELKRIPAVLGKNWLPHAKAYYVAEALGISDTFHKALFDAIHKEKKTLTDDKEIIDFFVQQGADRSEVKQWYETEEVDKKVKQAYLLGKQFLLTGVPAIVVHGQYLTSARLAGSNENLLRTVDDLVVKVREEVTP